MSFFFLWLLLVILSRVMPRTTSTLVIPLVSIMQSGCIIWLQQWTFILYTWSVSSNRDGLDIGVTEPKKRFFSSSRCSPCYHTAGWHFSLGLSQQTLCLCHGGRKPASVPIKPLVIIPFWGVWTISEQIKLKSSQYDKCSSFCRTHQQLSNFGIPWSNNGNSLFIKISHFTTSMQKKEKRILLPSII